ncbi:M15 family metallopeptidase [Nocardioides pyridinolyticus]
MSLGLRVVLLACVLALPLTGLSAAAGAAARLATSIDLSSAPAYSDTETTLHLRLQTDEGEPIANASVELARKEDGAWVPLGIVTTDDRGMATQPVRLSREVTDNVVRAQYAGDDVYPAATRQKRLELKRRAGLVRLEAPAQVKDGRTARIRVRWTTREDAPVQGPVKVFRSLAGGRWQLARTLRTDADGRAAFTTRPRQDSRWRARGVRQSWVESDTSKVHRIDNVPPGDPVRLPRGAPAPRRSLPPQAHAVGTGANPVVSRIPTRIWNHMTGISWRSGCPVGRAGLRLVRVNYWDYRGYPRRGELIAATSAAAAMGAAFAEMYQRKLPVRAMYRVDRFGWGARSRGGDDYASMAAGNTSAFNCRDVTGRPGVRSPHSYGRSLDVNTWENPYRSARGIVPNTWWQSRSHPRIAWRSTSHPVVQVMRRHGFRWTYGNGDTQHFDYVGSSARAMVAPRACDRYCD